MPQICGSINLCPAKLNVIYHVAAIDVAQSQRDIGPNRVT